MNPTFERRLLRKPVKSRLGGTKKGGLKSRIDLRQKLTAKKRVSDARSVLTNRRRPKALVLRNKTGKILKRLSRNGSVRSIRKVPLSAKRSIKNVAQRPARSRANQNRRRPIRRYPASGIPDLLSLPMMPPIFQPIFGSGRLLTSADTSINPPSTSNSKLSPLQGFRLSVRNLQPSVTLDDVYELFSNVGSLRSCNLVRPGHAEVVFNQLTDANEAINRYHNRELDGRPMNISLLTQVPSDVRGINRLASRLGPKIDQSWQATQSIPRPLTTNSISGGTKRSVEVDTDVIRKALFNVSSTGATSSRKPVDFNVSLR